MIKILKKRTIIYNFVRVPIISFFKLINTKEKQNKIKIQCTICTLYNLFTL